MAANTSFDEQNMIFSKNGEKINCVRNDENKTVGYYINEGYELYICEGTVCKKLGIAELEKYNNQPVNYAEPDYNYHIYAILTTIKSNKSQTKKTANDVRYGVSYGLYDWSLFSGWNDFIKDAPYEFERGPHGYIEFLYEKIGKIKILAHSQKLDYPRISRYDALISPEAYVDELENWIAEAEKKLGIKSDIPKTIYNNDQYILIPELDFNIEVFIPMLKYYEELYKNKNWLYGKKTLAFAEIESTMFMLDDSPADPTFVQLIKIPHNVELKIAIIGDIHSSLHSLHEIITYLKNDNFFVEDTIKLADNKYIFFLGDLVDWGPYGIEVLFYAFNLMKFNNGRVFIINGNHEDAQIYYRYGLASEINYQFTDSQIRKNIKKLLKYLPSAIILKMDNKEIIHLSHGAFDMDFSGFSKEEKDVYNGDCGLAQMIKHNIQFALIDHDAYNDYKWGDFVENNNWWQRNREGRNRFSRNLVESFTQNHNATLISGHQDTINFMFMHKNGTNTQVSIDAKIKNDSGKMQFYETGCKTKIDEKYRLQSVGNDISDDAIGQKNNCNKAKPGYDALYIDIKTKDSLSAITSTATISKNLNMNSFIILKPRPWTWQ